MSLALLFTLAWKSLLVMSLAAVAAWPLRRRSAAVRHAIWSAALLSLLALPLLSRLPVSWTPSLPAGVAVPLAPLERITVEVQAQDGKPLPVAALAGFVWLGGSLLLMMRLALRQHSAARLARRARRWTEQEPDVFLSGDVAMPIVCGLRQPRIVLPEEAASWGEERLRLVLLHERMHVARYDLSMQTLAALASALYWFNPLVWYASARLRVESEQACDDAVLLTGEEAPVYASHLVEIARSVRFDRPIPEGGIPMARMSQLEERLRALLNPTANRAAASGKALAALLLAALVTVVPLGALQTAAEPRSAQPGLTGVVKDPSGAVVPGARILVTHVDEQRSEVARTGEDGTFLIAPLPEGLWNVEVAKQGFAKLRLEKVRVSGPSATPLQMTLAVGGIGEKVSVVGEAPPPSPSQPPSAAGQPKAIRVGGNIMAARMLKKVNPSYPPECKAERVQGTVLLRTVISKTGEPLSLEPLNQLIDRRLVESALTAVRQWRWEPTLLNGQPVEIITEIEINYTLAN